MLGKHPSLDEVVEKIDSIQLDDVVQLAERLFSGPLVSPSSPLTTMCQKLFGVIQMYNVKIHPSAGE